LRNKKYHLSCTKMILYITKFKYALTETYLIATIRLGIQRSAEE